MSDTSINQQEQDGSEQTEEVADGSEQTEEVADGSEQTEEVTDGSEQTEEVADGSEQTEEVADGSEQTGEVADGSEQTEEVADGSEQTEEVVDGPEQTEEVATSHNFNFGGIAFPGLDNAHHDFSPRLPDLSPAELKQALYPQDTNLKRSARIRSRKSKKLNEQNMSLNVLAHVASETLKKEPNRAGKIAKNPHMKELRTMGTVELLNLDQILGLTEKTVLNLFTELSVNELARTFTFTCQLMPEKCLKSFTSFGTDMRARTGIRKHIYEHLSELEKLDAETREKFTAEPVHARKKQHLDAETREKITAEPVHGRKKQRLEPCSPQSILAMKGRLGSDIQDISADESEDEADRKVKKRNTCEGNQGWEQKLALKYIKKLKSRKKDENSLLKCRICDNKTFTASDTLMYHYRSHAGIKPFVCVICNTTFTRVHSLNYHMLIHNNQSRFSCKDCGRKFRHSSHFKEHLRKHTGETPFECPDCGQKFKIRITYKRHMKTRHGKLITATGFQLLSEEEFERVRSKRKQPRVRSKRKQTGKSKKVKDEMLLKSPGRDEKSVTVEEIKSDIRKETERDNESDRELADFLEALTQTATSDNGQENGIDRNPTRD